MARLARLNLTGKTGEMSSSDAEVFALVQKDGTLFRDICSALPHVKKSHLYLRLSNLTSGGYVEIDHVESVA